MADRLWALIKRGTVENVVVWDGESNWAPPDDVDVVEATGTGAAPGWAYHDGRFVEPPQADPVFEPPPEPAPDPVLVNL